MRMREGTPVKPEVGKRLKVVMRDQGLNGVAMAKLLGITTPTFSKILNGHAPLTEKRARKIMAQFPCYSLSFLLAIDDDSGVEKTLDSIRIELRKAKSALLKIEKIIGGGNST